MTAAALTPQNTIVLFRPYEHAAQFSRLCEAEALPVVPETLFVSSVKAAVYENGFYVAPHHSALQLDIHVTAFSSADVEAEGGHEAPMAKFRIYVKSAPARHDVRPLNAFVSGGLHQSPGTSKSSSIGDHHMEPDLELTSIYIPDPKIKADDLKRIPLGSSFFGLVHGDDMETTMVIPDGNCTVDGVIGATCEVLAGCFGWHVEKRSIGHRELASFSEVIATTTGLLPVRSITVNSEARTYKYVKSNEDFGDGYKLLSRVFDDTILGRTAYDFGWNVHSVYDTRFDILSQEKRIPEVDEKRVALRCRNEDLQAENFYFALLPARRFCN